MISCIIRIRAYLYRVDDIKLRVYIFNNTRISLAYDINYFVEILFYSVYKNFFNIFTLLIYIPNTKQTYRNALNFKPTQNRLLISPLSLFTILHHPHLPMPFVSSFLLQLLLILYEIVYQLQMLLGHQDLLYQLMDA